MEEKDSDYFFGRNRETIEVLASLAGEGRRLTGASREAAEKELKEKGQIGMPKKKKSNWRREEAHEETAISTRGCGYGLAAFSARGEVENANGRLRRSLPCQIDNDKLSDEEYPGHRQINERFDTARCGGSLQIRPRCNWSSSRQRTKRPTTSLATVSPRAALKVTSSL